VYVDESRLWQIKTELINKFYLQNFKKRRAICFITFHQPINDKNNLASGSEAKATILSIKDAIQL